MTSSVGSGAGESYRAAGVDIDAGEEAVKRIGPLVRSTYRPEVMGDIGGFGGLFELSHFMAWNRGYLIMPYFNMMLIAPQHTKEEMDGWLEVWDDIVKFAMGA